MTQTLLSSTGSQVPQHAYETDKPFGPNSIKSAERVAQEVRELKLNHQKRMMKENAQDAETLSTGSVTAEKKINMAEIEQNSTNHKSFIPQ